MLTFGELTLATGLPEHIIRHALRTGNFPMPIRERGRELWHLAEVEAWKKGRTAKLLKLGVST